SFKYGDFVQYFFQNSLEYGQIQLFVIKNNLMKVQIQKIIPYNKIPPSLYSEERTLQAQHEWILVEELSLHIIEPLSLVQKITVWLKDQQYPPFFDLFINEILYSFNGQ
ncbi:3891_t:CDS:1, partial [Dentiscutata erythropus]